MKKELKALAKFQNNFFLIAHRGASAEFPDNTLESFKRAVEIYNEAILELDVWETCDGKILVTHDEFLEISTDCTGAIKDKNIDEIKQCKAGYNITFDNGKTYPFRNSTYRMPELDEVLSAFPEARISIDIKYNDVNFSHKVLSLLREKGFVDKVIIASFHGKILRWVRKNHPEFATSFSRYEILRLMIMYKFGISCLYNCPGNALMVPEYTGNGKPEELGKGVSQGFRIVTPGLIKKMHRKGIPVFVWTIDKSENMKRLIKWGVDGIVTNYPNVLKKVVENIT